jgi:hypothetical protein
VSKKTNVYENCPETMQNNSDRTIRITFKHVIFSPVPMPFFHAFLPLAPSFSFGARVTVGWVKIFEGQVENNQENTSTSDQTNIKWPSLVLQAYPAEHIPSRMPLGFHNPNFIKHVSLNTVYFWHMFI